MTRHDYKKARPIIKSFFTKINLASLGLLKPEDLNSVYDELMWKRDADEERNKTNLIKWIRRNMPMYEPREDQSFSLSKLVRESMVLRPEIVSDCNDDIDDGNNDGAGNNDGRNDSAARSLSSVGPRERPVPAAKTGPKPQKQTRGGFLSASMSAEVFRQHDKQLHHPAVLLPLASTASAMGPDSALVTFEQGLHIAHRAFTAGDWAHSLLQLAKCTATVVQLDEYAVAAAAAAASPAVAGVRNGANVGSCLGIPAHGRRVERDEYVFEGGDGMKPEDSEGGDVCCAGVKCEESEDEIL
ncbi:hypothetical protein Slin15195_G129590 [Septoria linicola]|uniref:Uncharacterized protein n=1 Tax=Septoria linicola TaxID=215465 RepID=A0A9Q9EQZ9_9PEZI|nr:hypothetical protein Slin15195_G129590 [Septoria linicola]